MIKSIFLSEAIKLSIVIKDHCHLKPRLMEYGLRRLFSLEASVKKKKKNFSSFYSSWHSKDSDLSNRSSWQSLWAPI